MSYLNTKTKVYLASYIVFIVTYCPIELTQLVNQ